MSPQLTEFKKQEPKRARLNSEVYRMHGFITKERGSLSFPHLCNLCVRLLYARQCLATGGSAGAERLWILPACCLEGEWKHPELWAVVEGQTPKEDVTQPPWRDQRQP